MSYKLNARHLILDLLYASKTGNISIKRMLSAAQLLGISDNGMRVAASRLNQEGLLFSPERGVYQLIEKKFDTSVIGLAKTPSMHIAEQWSGQYMLVYTGHLGRVDRTALSKREKALRYYGFQELEQDLLIRPDNLSLDLDSLKAATVKFGLDDKAHFFHVDQVEDEARIQQLWNITALHANYASTMQHITQWFEQSKHMDLATAAKTAFYLGKTALFTLRSDPLLPAEWIDIQQRSAFESAVRELEQTGQDLWQQYFISQQV